MKKIISCFVLSIFLFTGCTNATYQSTAREYTKPVMEGELTIATIFQSDFLDKAAESFMEKYPDVKVTVNAGINPMDFMTILQDSEDGISMVALDDHEGYNTAIENYLTQLNMRLMNGSAEDIIFTRDLPLLKYIRMGVFEDLTFYLDNSPEINNDNHFMNIINAFEDDDSNLWQIPITFDLEQMIAFNKELVYEAGLFLEEEVNSMNYLEAIDYAIGLIENTNKEGVYVDFSLHIFTLVDNHIDDFVNINDKEVRLNSDEFISLLYRIEELYNGDYFPEIDEDTFMNIQAFLDNTYFAIDSGFILDLAFRYLKDDSELYSAMPLSDSSGNIKSKSNNTLAINSASDNKELAWEFIRFMLSDEFNFWAHDISINRSIFESNFRSYVEMQNSDLYKEIQFDLVNEIAQGWISQVNRSITMDENIKNIVIGELFDFLEDNQKTADETANSLQSSVTRYLNETY